jgi:hypothetical protein
MFQDKRFHAVTALRSLEEIAANISKALGQTAIHQWVPFGKFRRAYRVHLT